MKEEIKHDYFASGINRRNSENLFKAIFSAGGKQILEEDVSEELNKIGVNVNCEQLEIEGELEDKPIEMADIFNQQTIYKSFGILTETLINESDGASSFLTRSGSQHQPLINKQSTAKTFPHNTYSLSANNLDFKNKLRDTFILSTQRHDKRIRKTLNITSFIILPDELFKNLWCIFVIILLMYASLITPYRIAFFDKATIGWMIIGYIIDLLFTADLILNFFFAYYDKNGELVYNRKKIAYRYLLSWFIIDFIAIIPFDIFFNNNYNSLSRLLRLPKLYRLLKLTKILRTIRIWRERNTMANKHMSFLNAGRERLLAFIIVMLVFCHVAACMWYFVAKLEGITPDSWVLRNGLQDADNFSIYTASLYFTIMTTSTVGFGDIHPVTTPERWFAIVVMVIGVFLYSFGLSSLTSMLTSEDIKLTNEMKATESLRRIDNDYELNADLYLEIKKAIARKFTQVEYFKDRDSLLNLLPRDIKQRLFSTLHEQFVDKELLIFEKESVEFIRYISHLLKPRKYGAEEYIYKEGSEMGEIYFLLGGSVEYVLPQFDDTPYMHITKGLHFGDLDIVNSIINNDSGEHIFTAKAKEDCEMLVLSQTDLYRLYQKYEEQTVCIFEGAGLRLAYTMQQKKELERGLVDRVKKMKKLFRDNPSNSLQKTKDCFASYLSQKVRKSTLDINILIDPLIEHNPRQPISRPLIKSPKPRKLPKKSAREINQGRERAYTEKGKFKFGKSDKSLLKEKNPGECKIILEGDADQPRLKTEDSDLDDPFPDWAPT